MRPCLLLLLVWVIAHLGLGSSLLFPVPTKLVNTTTLLQAYRWLRGAREGWEALVREWSLSNEENEVVQQRKPFPYGASSLWERYWSWSSSDTAAKLAKPTKPKPARAVRPANTAKKRYYVTSSSDTNITAAEGAMQITGRLNDSCFPGVEVFYQPEITWKGSLVNISVPEAMLLRPESFHVSEWSVSGKKVCLCPRESALAWSASGCRFSADQCSIHVLYPPFNCPTRVRNQPYGLPACFSFDSSENMTFEFQLSCTLLPAENQSETVRFLSQDLGSLQYHTLAYYRATYMDYSPDQLHEIKAQNQFEFKIWNFNRLSDDRQLHVYDLTLGHLLGLSSLNVSIPVAAIENDFVISGRSFIQASISHVDTVLMLYVEFPDLASIPLTRAKYSSAIVSTTIVILSVVFAIGVACPVARVGLAFVTERKKRQRVKKA